MVDKGIVVKSVKKATFQVEARSSATTIAVNTNAEIVVGRPFALMIKTRECVLSVEELPCVPMIAVETVAEYATPTMQSRNVLIICVNSIAKVCRLCLGVDDAMRRLI